MDQLLKDNCAANAKAVDDLVGTLERLTGQLKAAKLAFEAAATWDQHDAAYAECAAVAQEMPDDVDVMWHLVKDPT